MTIIFFGSSEFSLAALRACLENSHQVLLVITTPDKPKGRGLKLTPTPVRQYCREKGIPVEAPQTLKDPLGLAKVEQLQPDLFVVSSYGKMIPASWLKVPAKLALNVHPSLLPRYRGAAPINWPILNGDQETGITIAEVTSQLDSGDIFYQERIPLDLSIDAETLSHQLAQRSYPALQAVFKKIAEGSLSRTPQEDAAASYARKLTKEDAKLSLEKPAAILDRFIRGLKPWPGSFIFFNQTPLHILKAQPLAAPLTQKPGTLLEIGNDGSISLATGEGILKVFRVQPAGKKEMAAADFVRGRHLTPGFVFESSPGAATG